MAAISDSNLLARLTVHAERAALFGRGRLQAPEEMFTTAPLLLSTIPGRVSRVTRLAAMTLLFNMSQNLPSDRSVKL